MMQQERRPQSVGFRLKRLAFAPVTRHRRRRWDPHDSVGRSLMEEQYFRSPMIEFLHSVGENPDLLFDFDLSKRSLVVDAGAYVGEWSERIAETFGCEVHAFEPNPHVQEALRARLEPHGCHIHRVGLASSDRVAALVPLGPGSTVVAAGTASLAVTLRDVLAVFEDLGRDRIDLLKLNVEGAEYEVLQRLLEGGWLPRIGSLLVQFHEWHPGAYRRRRSLRRALRRTHEERWCYPWVFERWDVADR